MIIYQDEINAGLSEQLSAKSSIVYASLVEKSTEINEESKNCIIQENKTLAGLTDKDLYYTQSILVTTSWNKNDDVFDPIEVWKAKNTPEDKPTNLEHNENLIVGHITSNWPVDDDGNIIDNNTDLSQLPYKYHILTGSVIYTGYTDPELKERATTLINEIENGTKYVSMECFFKGFDYGLTDKTTGKFHILQRNDETAFLTKHLRAYGGQGEHQNYKIGRVLRDITFSGKGFVNKPANPESIIFTKESLGYNKDLACIKNYIEKNDISENKGVFSNQANLKETIMSVEPEVPQTEEEVVSQTETVESPAAEVSDASEVEHEEAAKKMAEDMKKKEEEMVKMKAALENLKSELDAANESLAGYKSKELEMMKKEKKAKRMASLVDSGLDNETAEATVEKFDSLDDETFATITSLVAAKKMAKKEEEMVEEKKKASVVEADASVLETAEVEESVNLSVASDEESQVHNTRAALVDFVCIRLGKKLNKGE